MTATVDQLAAILRGAGLTVDTSLAGPGEGDGGFSPVGLILHHDAGGLSYVPNWDGHDNTAVAQDMARPGTNGAQFWVGRSGTWYILSAGRKWHAGIGQGYGSIPANSGNTYAYGIETDYGPVRPGWDGATYQENGYTWPAWDDTHRQAIYDGSRALGKALGLSTFCGHREYAPDRKIDPADGLNLDDWRAYINANPTPVPPAPEDDMFSDQDRATLAQVAADTAKSRAALYTTAPGVVDPKTGKPSGAADDILAALLSQVQALTNKVDALAAKVGAK